MDELRECPFCGGQAEYGRSDAYDYGYDNYYVYCPKCWVQTENDQTNDAVAGMKASAKLWNTRTDARITALEKELAAYRSHGPSGRNVTNAQYLELDDALTAEREKVTRLVEVLTEMVEMIDSGDEPGNGSAWHVKARAAIDAARGE